MEPGTISGTVAFDCKKQRSIQEYGFCSCVQLEPDYYDEDFIDLVENPDIGKKHALKNMTSSL